MSTTMAIALISIGLVATGCASQRTGTDADAHSHGMMFPKCETVWMSKLEGQGTKMQRLSSVKGMTCPDCDAMAKAYMERDKMVLHDCPTCKVKPVEVTRAAPGTHQRGTHP